MPRYGTNSPLALYMGDTGLAWGTFDSTTSTFTGETVQPSVPLASQAFELPPAPGGDGTIFAVVEIQFAGAPGAFLITVQEAETDTDSAYIVQSAAAFTINAVNAGQFARADLQFKSKFVRIRVVSLTNNVTLIAKISR